MPPRASKRPRRAAAAAAAAANPFENLPEPIVDIILDNGGKGGPGLLALACTDKWLNAKVAACPAGLWQAVLDECIAARPAAAQEIRKCAKSPRPGPRELLRLAGFTGCQLCGAKRIRKVYWEFGVRCCEPCLHANTVSHKHLKEELGLSEEQCQAEGVRCRKVQMWMQEVGYFTTRFYWREDLLPVVCAVRGGSLEQLRERARKQQAAEAAKLRRQHEAQLERGRRQREAKRE
jgi:hypothetical protein